MNILNKAKEGVKKFINGIKNVIKKIGNAIKFFVTPIGYVVGWLLIILICTFLLLTIFEYVATVFSELAGDYPNYTTFEDDVGYIQDLVSSGYERTLDAENFQNFKSFEYAVLMDAAEFLRQPGEVAQSGELVQSSETTQSGGVAQMEVAYETNQENLSKVGQTALDNLVNVLTSRSVKVENFYSIINEEGSVSGGNTKVTPPTLVYEFKKGSMYSYLDEDIKTLMNKEEKKEDEAEVKTPQETLTAGSTIDGSAAQLLEDGKLKGALYPYVYIVREDIDFTYYFSDKNSDNMKRVVEYKYELNVNNPYMTGSGAEFLKEIERYNKKYPDSELGTVEPGQSYTERVFYTDVTTPVVYKIPLITLIGRYMPKLELLQAWTTLKQDVDKEGDAEMVDLVDEVIACIKGVYNEACLEGETRSVIKSGEKSGEEVCFSDTSTHNKTFATFETAGIEKTLYGINGLKEAEGEELKVFTDCVNAIIIEKSSISAQITYADGTSGEATFEISEIAPKDWSDNGYVAAQEAENGKYIAPSSFESTALCVVNKSIADVEAILESLIMINCEGAVNVDVDISGIAKRGVAFSFEDRSPTDTLGVEHTRMPILLVKSVTTWARQINYVHTLTQNGFDQNSKWYIIPNSVSSIGLMNFQSSLKDGNEETYRGAAYTQIFARMKEKDVLDILLQLEEDALAGSNDCYEYMRDVYRLLEASKEYSAGHISTDINQNINPETYSYLYIPDSVLYYNDTLTQKIYWIDLFTAVMPLDQITSEELKNVRTKRNNLTWQVVEYEKYPECNETGKTLVYAINPFASSYLRAYYEKSYQMNKAFEHNLEINGSYGKYVGTDHSGSDWGGRSRISKIYATRSSGDALDDENSVISSSVYKYELNRLTNIYGEAKAKEKITSDLNKEKVNLPIVAVAPGIVDTVTYSSRSGIYVKIQHTKEEPSGDEVYTAYLHLKRWPLVEEGDYVGAGTLLGYEGETGRAFGSHLHYQIQKGGMVPPCEYTYPSFNPFYNEELAAKDSYSMSSEYMSLYRTVIMTEDGKGVTNQHPIEPLVDNFEDLIQNQGEFDKTKVSMSGELGWNSSGKYVNSKEYIEYLASNSYYDLYIKEAYKDYNLAKKGGYLDIPPWLWDALGEMDFVVNTEMPGSLPALTREELVYILENWLPARYGESKVEFGAESGKVKKVDWLMQNVFTDDTIDKIIEYQDQYHVSAVFALAVATIEQNMGLSGTDLALAPACNIFSIKGKIGGGIEYQEEDLYWNVYSSYGNAFGGFDRLIATSPNYFMANKYTIMAIAPTYCNASWGSSVSKIASDILKFYIGNWETPFGDFMLSGGNDEFAKAAENCMNWLNTFKNNFSYGAGVRVPPYKGDFGAPNSSQMDCSGYVSWVIHEYGKANGIDVLDKIGRWSTSNFKALGDAIQAGRDYQGVAKYFELVATRAKIPSGKISNIKDTLQAGDIILYKEGTGHHVEIVKETGSTKVYTCGSASGWRNPGAQSYTRRSDVTYIFRLKKGVQ